MRDVSKDGTSTMCVAHLSAEVTPRDGRNADQPLHQTWAGRNRQIGVMVMLPSISFGYMRKQT